MNVLFTPLTSSSIAHMVRSFSLAEEFQKKGDRVYFTSCTGKEKFLKNQGYDVVRTYTPFNLNDPKDQSVNYLSTHKREMLEWFTAEIEAAKEIKADVVITSPGFFGPQIYYATGIPVVALMNGQYLPSSKGLMGISVSTDTLRDKLLRSILHPIFKRSFVKNYLGEILDAYKKIGIKVDIKTRDELYAPMHILIPGDEEFEPQEHIDKGSKHIGPIFWEGFENMETDLTEKRLNEFKGDSKLIFITFGGSLFDLDTYERILNHLCKLKAKIIVALGPNFPREQFERDNDNLIIRTFVPGLRVSKFSDVVVNTGSQGAIMQALKYGKPVVSFPVGIDQAYFANRLEEMGVGMNVNKINILKFSKRESYQIKDNRVPERLISAISHVLRNPKYKKNAQEYAIRLKERNYKPSEEVINFIYNIVEKK
jgi:UDP:flavonoid glycosyltransferase YjiC (YdhE family)